MRATFFLADRGSSLRRKPLGICFSHVRNLPRHGGKRKGAPLFKAAPILTRHGKENRGLTFIKKESESVLDEFPQLGPL